jgi:HEPN domain-containing protein
MRPPEEVRKVLVRQWMDKAQQDMAAGEALLATEPPFLYPACFHAQQAAEKYLKALLTAHQIECPKTHAIERLLDLVKPVDAEASSGLEAAAELTPYGVDIRYPGDQPEPDMAEGQRAAKLARKARDVVVAALGRIGILEE